MPDIPKRFQELRKTRGYSVYRLSQLSDISQNYIHSIEKGKNQPSVYVLDKLLTCLGSNLAEFFNDGQEVLYPTAFEKELIARVRLLDDEKQKMLLELTAMLYHP